MIQATELTKRFGDTLAVDRLSFTIEPGVVTGFLGPNGAGKSTTMRMIMGLDRPTGGAATVNGRAYRDLAAPLREVGALLEATAASPGRSAFTHLLALARSNRIPRRRVDEVLERVGLAAVARKPVRTFSLGMRQRLGLAVALLGDPGVLVLDEPVNGLDPEGIVWLRTLLKAYASEGRTVFVSSHLMSEMAVTAEHLIVIGRGKLVADTTTSEFVERSSENSVVVRGPRVTDFATVLENAGGTVRAEDDALIVTALPMPRIGDLAAEHSVVLHELSARRASLETAFMEILDQHSATLDGRPALDADHATEPNQPTGTEATR